MFKSKEIKRLKDRLDALEKDIKAILSVLSQCDEPKEQKATYEEVINEWLCGKETN
ncbi:MAG: hypothetical protein J6B45_00145 [Clostridia bacterium]|nr:hypothetical protein [Clostridia bacterium]